MAPEWEAFQLEHGDKYNIAQVDCQTKAGGELCRAFHYTEMPTMVYLPLGKSDFYKFNGRERKIASFVDFAEHGWKNVDG
mmetsp:Transcript_7379/g.10469  ORF Transcript_7379/g.10469 Transcript_7379/m.10469 type:complete len:80 (+) Transcript_7379:166-405(+)|eukprot:CAMPEP_0185584976 /NCGR_PEP_ID=MMETSP0434-20130131/35673_1 /TAXON_ID=626734 ORGANISM="Favella taraikaensis, Strain Fe Narragansett Bay" /NCGR_SAMPLE_ID=MMETSP0434 /ASSEMBLY_ACC=CAM_ASM_000379 /LENGTH=79 /DNA_ID=CAMNT_0028205043 /DNA_START=103 /DNA_END=342 /DNA_ORIENTATION=-